MSEVDELDVDDNPPPPPLPLPRIRSAATRHAVVAIRRERLKTAQEADRVKATQQQRGAGRKMTPGKVRTKVKIESRAERQRRLESKIANALGDAHMLLDDLDDI
jgi:hypothetical protein